MIVFDTETTGLTLRGNAPLDKQPYMIEFAGIKLDDESLEEVDRLEFMCKPPVKITAEITKITKITDDGTSKRDVGKSPPFFKFYPRLASFFIGEGCMVCHNLGFDRAILEYELRRHGVLTKFPWPTDHICTVERTEDLNGHRVKLIDLYEHYFGEKFEGAHEAMRDVEALTNLIRAMRKDNRI